MIAMKSYLLLALFFIGLLGSPISGFTQEDSSSAPSVISPSTESLESPESTEPTDAHSPSSIQENSTSKKHGENDDFPAVWGDQKGRETDTFQTKFFNMLFLLGLLIGFMILASWALKRMMKSKMTHLNTGSNIKVLETRYLSPRATLYLVEIQDQAILLAESPTSVTYLTTLPLEESSSPPSYPKT